MKSFNCIDCGTVEHVFIDGYHFGDRLLEEVMFKVWFENGKMKAAPKSDGELAYIKRQRVSVARVCADAVAYVTDNPDSCECSSCGESGGFIEIIGEDE